MFSKNTTPPISPSKPIEMKYDTNDSNNNGQTINGSPVSNVAKYDINQLKKVPKIYFATHTHSQIKQIVQELKQTGNIIPLIILIEIFKIIYIYLYRLSP